MAHIELIVADESAFIALIDRAVAEAKQRRQRLWVIGNPMTVARASFGYMDHRGELPQHLDFIEIDGPTLRSTLPDHIRVRDGLLAASQRPSRLVAIVPPLRGPASICPLIATARCAQAGALFLTTPEVAASVPMHLLNPTERRAA
jgi:hypothetical protein